MIIQILLVFLEVEVFFSGVTGYFTVFSVPLRQAL